MNVRMQTSGWYPDHRQVIYTDQDACVHLQQPGRRVVLPPCLLHHCAQWNERGKAHAEQRKNCHKCGRQLTAG